MLRFIFPIFSLFVFFFFACIAPQEQAQALLEGRLHYGGIPVDPDPITKKAPQIGALTSLGADAIISPPLFPFAFGLRYELLGASERNNFYDEVSVNFQRLAAIASWRPIELGFFVGAIGTWGFAHWGETRVDPKTGSVQEFGDSVGPSYSMGIEGGGKLFGFLVGVETGRFYMKDEGLGPIQKYEGIYFKAHIGNSFLIPMDLQNTILIFTDGACSGNPGPGGFGAIIAYPHGHIQELGGGDSSTTNNRMEMTAVIRALESLASTPQNLTPKNSTSRNLSPRNSTPEKLWVMTDSTYVIRGITQWIWAWKKRSWKTAGGTPVINKDLWERLHHAVDTRQKIHFLMEWKYVRGHIGVPGNERCDEIAVEFTKKKKPQLYSGPLLHYPFAIHDLPEDMSLPPMKSSSPKSATHSYLSYVNGKLQRHKTWKECEAVVKGRPGAKFKKSASAQNEREIVQGWGLSPNSLDKLIP